ncbi:MAG: lycopene cyclase family protein, partial [Pseudomonadota bacterium]
MIEHQPYDFLFAGGGLASGLTAYRLAQTHPEAKIAIVEAGDTLGGNHTWSFHETDVSPEQHGWLDPFVVHRWPGQNVAFPHRQRTLSTGYRSITAERFHGVLSACPTVDIFARQRVEEATPTSLLREDGTRLKGRIVFDGRGPKATPDMELGFQKFLGLEVEFE